jgi:ribosomal protein S17E
MKNKITISPEIFLKNLFPKENRSNRRILDINKILEKVENIQLSGDLNLNDFPNLEKFFCSGHLINSIDLTKCPKINSITCQSCILTKIKFPKEAKDKLIFLDLTSNNFPKQDLSMFSELVKLRYLHISNNNFFGSLEFLRNLNNLSQLRIEYTNLETGLEFLSDSVKNFYCSKSEENIRQKSDIISPLIADLEDERDLKNNEPIRNFPEKLQAYKKKYIIYADYILENEVKIYQESENKLKRRIEELEEQNDKLIKNDQKKEKVIRNSKKIMKKYEKKFIESLEADKKKIINLTNEVKKTLDEPYHGYLEIILNLSEEDAS